MNRFLFFTSVLLTGAVLRGEETVDPTAPFSLVRESQSSSSLEGLGRIVADRSLFANTREGFSDVRLFRLRDDEILEWPYLVRETRPRKRSVSARSIDTEIVAFDKTNEEELIHTLSLPAKSPAIDTLQIHSPLRNFEKTVTVYGRETTAGEWSLLVDRFLIYDRQEYVDFRRTRVGIPLANYRMLRVHLGKASDEQQSELKRVTKTLGGSPGVTESFTVETRKFRVDRFTVLTPALPKEPSRGIVNYPASISGREENQEERETHLLLDTGTAPLSRIELDVSDRNFRRVVRIEKKRNGESDEWIEIGRSTIHRYDVAGLEEEDLVVEFPEAREKELRLAIENGDDRPLDVGSASGVGPLVELVFLTEPGDRWNLYFNAPEADLKRPDYDTAVIEKAESTGVPREGIGLAPAHDNPAFDREAGISAPPWFAEKWILHLLIAGVVAILIRVLYQAARRVEGEEGTG